MRNFPLSILIAAVCVAGASFNGFCGQSDPSPVQIAQALRHKNSADAFLRRDQVSLAIGEYQKAVALNPRSTAAYFNLAVAYYSEKNWKGAKRALRKVLALDKHDAEARYNLACLSLREGNLEGAGRGFKRVLKNSPVDSAFRPLAAKGLRFVDRIKKEDPGNRTILLRLLRDLPTLRQSD